MLVTFHDWQGATNPIHEFSLLKDREIQVWTANAPETRDEINHYSHLLSETERLRASSLMNDVARNEFIIGRALVRLIGSSLLHIKPSDIMIGSNRHGKPNFTGDSSANNLRFNVSHSHSLVTIALARGREIGIDIEWIDETFDGKEIAARIFSPAELSELHSLSEYDQRVAFYNGWTRKEAYLKATGEGLTDDMSSIELTLLPNGPARLLRLPAPKNPTDWTIHDLTLPSGFAGALVFEK